VLPVRRTAVASGARVSAHGTWDNFRMRTKYLAFSTTLPGGSG
jgi:hypothetical protein